jgi:enamine deaminase RidA (YjgF/YER057c/UK114 family)
MRYPKTLLASLLAAGLSGCSAPQPPAKIAILPPGRERNYDEYHFAPAVRVGDLVIVSGIPAAVGDSYEEKIAWMFERLKATLEASGATLDDVVEITTFHRDPKDTQTFQQEFDRFLAVHRTYFRNGYPAWTAVGATALLSPSAPVEMRAVAIIGAGRGARVQRGDGK